MRYKIKNAYLEASIDDLGAQLCSLKKVNDSCEYIWQADENYWNRHAPILFPIVGKLKDNTFSYEDKNYKMTQHGFARDKEFELVKQKNDFICFRLSSCEKTLENYPFEFELYLSYELKNNSLITSYEVVNNSNKKMYFSIGAHPAFNWPLCNEEKEDCYLEFLDIDSFESHNINEVGLSLDTKTIPLKENKLFLNEELFENDALITKDLKYKNITYKNKKNDRFISVGFNDFPYLGLWSKPQGADFLCIEPWCGVADFENHNGELVNKKGINILNENEIFNSSFCIKI